LFHSARADSKPTASAVPKSSRNNPPKTTTTVPERSQSELPITTEAISKLSVHPGESRSQTTPRPAYRRRTLYSAVPDTAMLTPIRRPEEYGKAGRPIQIYTNHFKVSIDDAIVNQYDIEIVMIRRDGKTSPARKNERWETLKELAKREKDFPIVW